MLVWRLCRRPHADLSGTGGRLASGRWHTAGRPIVYTAYEPALAILEVRVNLDLPFEDLPVDYVMMAIDLGNLPTPIPNAATPATLSATRAVGDAWLTAKTSPVLRVPSVLAPRASNVLINPLHPDAAKLGISGIKPFEFDRRLWR